MYRRLPFVVLAAALLVVTASRPARAAANKEHQQLMADIRMLQEQSQQIQLMLGTLTDALKTMTTRLDDQATVNRKAFADQKLVIDNFSGDLRVVREKVDETNVKITSLSQELDALREAIPRIPVAPPTPEGAPADQTTSAPATPSVPAPTPAPLNPGLSPQRLFDTAWADYTAGQWSLAIEGFKTFLRAFPTSNQADDAQLLIGESFFLDGKYTDALDAYDQVIKNYPTGDKLPDAYFKRGVVFDRLGQTDRARQSYDFVARNYPDTPAGRQAKQRLNRQE